MTWLVVAAVGILVAFAGADALRSGRPSPTSGTSPATTTGRSPSFTAEETHATLRQSWKQEIRLIGNRWAQLLAAGRISRCFHMLRPACRRIPCVRPGGLRIENCQPPTSTLRRSFRRATVRGIVIQKGRAEATFSNGEVVELHGDGGTWWIRRLGDDVNREFFD